MLVKITNGESTKKTYWYYNKIGEVFETKYEYISHLNQFEFIVINNNKYNDHYIDPDDCVIIAGNKEVNKIKKYILMIQMGYEIE